MSKPRVPRRKSPEGEHRDPLPSLINFWNGNCLKFVGADIQPAKGRFAGGPPLLLFRLKPIRYAQGVNIKDGDTAPPGWHQNLAIQGSVVVAYKSKDGKTVELPGAFFETPNSDTGNLRVLLPITESVVKLVSGSGHEGRFILDYGWEVVGYGTVNNSDSLRVLRIVGGGAKVIQIDEDDNIDPEILLREDVLRKVRSQVIEPPPATGIHDQQLAAIHKQICENHPDRALLLLRTFIKERICERTKLLPPNPKYEISAPLKARKLGNLDLPARDVQDLVLKELDGLLARLAAVVDSYAHKDKIEMPPPVDIVELVYREVVDMVTYLATE